MIHVYVSYLNYKMLGGKMVAYGSFNWIPFLLPLNIGSPSVFHFSALFFFPYILSSSKFIFLSHDYLMTFKSIFSPGLPPSPRP